MNKYIEEYWKNSDITDLSADQLRVRINVQYMNTLNSTLFF